MLRLGTLMESSIANGPGKRFVIWLQGCEFGCEHCINIDFQNKEGGYEISIEELICKIEQSLEENQINGITLSGGEPLLQAECLYKLINKVKRDIGLDVFLFTGFTFSELNDVQRKVWDICDIIVSGRYLHDQNGNHDQWCSSTNQKLYFNQGFEKTDLLNDISNEIRIEEDGSIIITGFVPDKELIDQILNDLNMD